MKQQISHNEQTKYRFIQNLKQWFAKRDNYSWSALVLLVLGELFAFGGIHFCWSIWRSWTLAVILLLVVLWLIGINMHHKLNIRSVILTKLLANAIVPQKLGSIYLFLFVIHIGWLTNAAMSLFVPSKDPDYLTDILFAVTVCVLGLIVLIIFFPNGQYNKADETTEVIFSGMSKIDLPYAKEGETPLYAGLNLRALVRIVENKDLTRSELVILRSDYSKKKDNEMSNDIKKVLKFVFCQQKVQGLLETEKEIEDHVNELLDGQSVDNQLRLLIKEVIRTEFPDKKGIDNMKIDFSAQCDYNEFKSCYDALAEKVREKDTHKKRLTFYISPGTALVGAVITLMAIDGERELYYYSQGNESSDSARLKYINKKEVPLRNLLSQALDTLEDNNH